MRKKIIYKKRIKEDVCSDNILFFKLIKNEIPGDAYKLIYNFVKNFNIEDVHLLTVYLEKDETEYYYKDGVDLIVSYRINNDIGYLYTYRKFDSFEYQPIEVINEEPCKRILKNYINVGNFSTVGIIEIGLK